MHSVMLMQVTKAVEHVAQTFLVMEQEANVSMEA